MRVDLPRWRVESAVDGRRVTTGRGVALASFAQGQGRTMIDEDRPQTLDTQLDPALDTVLEVALDELDDPQEDIATIEQPSLAASEFAAASSSF
jgi:hypothetical protein